jgi:hypothetical protein
MPFDMSRQRESRNNVQLEVGIVLGLEATSRQEVTHWLVARSDDQRCDKFVATFGLNELSQPVKCGLFDASP